MEENNKPNKKLNKKKCIIIAVSTVLLIIITCLIFAYVKVTGTLSKAKRTVINEKNLNITEEPEGKFKGTDITSITNILLLGTDEGENDTGRSDATMIASIDPTRKKLKLISLQRDSYVNIPENGYQKLNHAFAYGGGELSISTVNKNFGLNITDYAKVNFEGIQAIVDELGGVEVRINAEETHSLNNYIERMCRLDNSTPKYVTQGGVTLNGFQALGYLRIRDTSGGDFDRTERQRKLIGTLLKKISAAGVMKMPDLLDKLLPYVETSLSNTEILNLGWTVITKNITTPEAMRFPRDCDVLDGGKIVNDLWVLPFNEKLTREKISDYIFGDEKPDDDNYDKDSNDNTLPENQYNSDDKKEENNDEEDKSNSEKENLTQ